MWLVILIFDDGPIKHFRFSTQNPDLEHSWHGCIVLIDLINVPNSNDYSKGERISICIKFDFSPNLHHKHRPQSDKLNNAFLWMEAYESGIKNHNSVKFYLLSFITMEVLNGLYIKDNKTIMFDRKNGPERDGFLIPKYFRKHVQIPFAEPLLCHEIEMEIACWLRTHYKKMINGCISAWKIETCDTKNHVRIVDDGLGTIISILWISNNTFFSFYKTHIGKAAISGTSQCRGQSPAKSTRKIKWAASTIMITIKNASPSAPPYQLVSFTVNLQISVIVFICEITSSLCHAVIFRGISFIAYGSYTKKKSVYVIINEIFIRKSLSVYADIVDLYVAEVVFHPMMILKQKIHYSICLFFFPVGYQ